MRPNEQSNLATLAYIYAPWFAHMQHDALSDATVLKHVVMAAIPNWTMACYVFSCSSEYFIRSVGLNTFRVRNPLPFPTSP